MKACEDCEDEVPRRRRCKRCGLLVCPFCDHHVHALERWRAAQATAIAQAAAGALEVKD
jgi:hypothetical protein